MDLWCNYAYCIIMELKDMYTTLFASSQNIVISNIAYKNQNIVTYHIITRIFTYDYHSNSTLDESKPSNNADRICLVSSFGCVVG